MAVCRLKGCMRSAGGSAAPRVHEPASRHLPPCSPDQLTCSTALRSNWRRGTAAAVACWEAWLAACWALWACRSGGLWSVCFPALLPPEQLQVHASRHCATTLICCSPTETHCLPPWLVPVPCSGALELVGAVSAGLASSAGVVYVPQPRRDGRTLALAPADTATEAAAAAATAAAAGSSAQAADPPPPPAVISAARLMQHPALLAHTLEGPTRGLGSYLAHTPLAAAAVLQGAEGLRVAHFAAGFALQQPVLLVTDAAVVLFASGGLEAVLVLPLAHTGEAGLLQPCIRRWCRAYKLIAAISCVVRVHKYLPCTSACHCLQRPRCGTPARRLACSPAKRRPRGSPARRRLRQCCAA